MSPAAGPPSSPTKATGRAWLVWGVAVAAYLVSVTQRTSFGVVGLQATERFDATASILAVFSVVQLLVYAGLQIPVGALADRFGSKFMIAGGAVLMASGQVVLGLAGTTAVGFVGRVLVGAGDAMTFVSVMRLLPGWFPARINPVISQLTGGVGQMGQIISLVPFAWLIGFTGWTQSFLALGSLSAVMVVLVLCCVREAPRAGSRDGSSGTGKTGEGHRPEAANPEPGTGALAVVSAPKPLSAARSVAAAWKRPGTRLGFFTHMISAFAVNVVLLSWGYPFLVSAQGLPQATASLLLGLFVVVAVGFGPVVGMVVARYPLRRSVVVLTIAATSCLAWLVVIFWPGQAPLWLLVIFCLIVASGGPTSMVAFDYARTENPPHLVGAATGLANVGSFFGGLAAIWAIGVVLDLMKGHTGDDLYALSGFRIAFLVVPAVYLIGGVGFLWQLRRTRALRVAEGGRPVRPLRIAVADRLRRRG
ncbi:nitrate/nitrite transporter [Galactobacter sp.]|uniref:MFS transporter n=1 Tax=Galactobacter sp. TaxID=2676125 RepID=UPI0025C1E0B2|nr:MFS transporter [Galactobacter sp.]